MGGEQGIEVRDVGPVESIVAPYDGAGGVYVFRGPNGAGKTHALGAIQGLRDKGALAELSSRDGGDRGYVHGFGVSVSIGRRTDRRGDLGVRMIGGEDPSAIADPGYKDPAVNDEHRLRAMCRLLGVDVDVPLFAELCGGEAPMRETLKPATLALAGKNDLPGFADAVRRDVNAAALAAENTAQNDGLRSQGIMDTLRDVCMDAEHDEVALRGRVSAAERELAQAEEAVRQQARRITAADAARARLAEAESDRDAGAKDRLEGRLDELRDTRLRVDGDIARIDETLSSVRTELALMKEREATLQRERAELCGRIKALDVEHQSTLRGLDDCDRHQRLLDSWRAEIEAGAIPAGEVIGSERIEALRAAKAQADAANDAGVVVRRALGQKAQADGLADSSRAARKRGEALRAIARGVDEVVAKSLRRVAPEGWGVSDGRLTMKTSRGTEMFERLSPGQRWFAVLDVAIKAVGAGGVLSIKQEAWEGLDPMNRAETERRCRAAQVTIYTAEADAGSLRIEKFEAVGELDGQWTS